MMDHPVAAPLSETINHSERILDELCINAIRVLAMDAVQRANSGHPGLPLGAAPMAYVLWTRYLQHNPANPSWPNRDRFVLSAGHGSMLLYSLLYLTGYDLSLDELKRFRQWGSRAPGHPERGLTPGVETTTGPLGQGFANGVGLAIAERFLAAHFNRSGYSLVDHYTYGLVSDGDLMEGVTAEAASLAGHLGLSKLIYLYDQNGISLAGSTALTFSEDVMGRFAAYGWQVEQVEDGNDVAALDAALQRARADKTRPSLICVRTHIGYSSPHKQDTFEAHGAPLGEEEVRLARQRLGWPSFGRHWCMARLRKLHGNNGWRHTGGTILPWLMSMSACWLVTCQLAGKRRFPSLHLAMGRWPRAKPAAKSLPPWLRTCGTWWEALQT
jgi:transketolase